MRTEDFEKAIDALCCDITMDEVKLSKGQVSKLYGHKGTMLLMWDDMGRGFSVVLNTIEKEDIDSDTHCGVVDSCYDRNTAFDLKFQ